jgi:hypothetical protein
LKKLSDPTEFQFVHLDSQKAYRVAQVSFIDRKVIVFRSEVERQQEPDRGGFDVFDLRGGKILIVHGKKVICEYTLPEEV